MSRKYSATVRLFCALLISMLNSHRAVWSVGRNLPSQGNTGTGTRGLVHLTEDQSDLGLALELNDTSLLHFVVQVVTLTGTLTDTAEDGETTVSLGNVVLTHVSTC